MKAEKFDQLIAVDERGDLLVTVKDSGSGFDPSRLPDPIAVENLAGAYSYPTVHGRGSGQVRSWHRASHAAKEKMRSDGVSGHSSGAPRRNWDDDGSKYT